MHDTLNNTVHSKTPAYQIPSAAASVRLDLLRVTAALCVFLSHWRSCLFVDYSRLTAHSRALDIVYFITGFGHEWVIVFFVLSGYLVGGSVLRQLSEGRWSWIDYVINRLTRLMIVLVPALFAGMLLDLAGIQLFGLQTIYGSHTSVMSPNMAHNVTPAVFLGNLVFLQTILVPVLGTNGPLWSLAYEFWFYIAFPFLAMAIYQRRSFKWRSAHVLALVAVLLFAGRDISEYFLIWLLGVAIYWLPLHITRNAHAKWLLYPAALVVFIAMVGARSYHGSRLIPDLVMGIAVVLLVYVCLLAPSTRCRGKMSTIIERGAHSSYTLYLVHLPLIVFMTAYSQRSRWQPTISHVGAALGMAFILLLYSQAMYFLFESRTKEVRRWLRARVYGSTRAAHMLHLHTPLSTDLIIPEG